MCRKFSKQGTWMPPRPTHRSRCSTTEQDGGKDERGLFLADLRKCWLDLSFSRWPLPILFSLTIRDELSTTRLGELGTGLELRSPPKTPQVRAQGLQGKKKSLVLNTRTFSDPSLEASSTSRNKANSVSILFTITNPKRLSWLSKPVKILNLWLIVITETNVTFHDKIPHQEALRKQSSLFIFHKTVYVYFLGTHSCGYTFILQEGEGRPLAIYLRMNYHCDWQYCSIFLQKKVDVLSAWKKSLIYCGKIFRL